MHDALHVVRGVSRMLHSCLQAPTVKSLRHASVLLLLLLLPQLMICMPVTDTLNTAALLLLLLLPLQPQVMPLVLELTKRVAARMDQAAAAAAAAAAADSSADGSAQPGALFDVSDAAKRITSDVMGQMLLGEDLQGTQWK
jgi:hypothetical protein